MRRGPGTARDFSNGRPAMDFSTASRSGQGVWDIGRVRTGTARDFSTAARYGPGVCDIGRVRPGTARDVSTAAGYGQGLIVIRPAAATRRSEKSAGCGCGSRFQIKCHALAPSINLTSYLLLISKHSPTSPKLSLSSSFQHD